MRCGASRPTFVGGRMKGRVIRQSSSSYVPFPKQRCAAYVVVQTEPDQEISEYASGNLAVVLAVKQRGSEVTVRFRNGSEARFIHDDPSNIRRGDVILVGNNNWVKVPKSAWQEQPIVYVVRKVLDGRLLVEVGSLTKTVPYSGDEDLLPGYTIEYFEISEKVTVLHETPIRALDYRDSQQDLASQFEVTFDKPLGLDDFGGYHRVVQRANEILRLQLDQQESIKAIGAKPIRGVIFSGPPGTGKTMLAQIIASLSQAKFFVVSGPQIVSKWVGESEEVLRSIFESARKVPKAIIFFDEIDSVASRRSEDTHEASNRLVAQLLTLMDGASKDQGNVVVVAATNRITEIDPALMRPGRFDWEIAFDLPHAEDRFEILTKSGATMTTFGDLPYEYVAEQTNGWSGAELGAIWTEAMICALRGGAEAVSGDDFIEGFERAADNRVLKMKEGKLNAC
ncbi:transitional endoplasmic reticulum ATPase [Arthrobacter sp. UNCCL28]|nr:transitional endoplasmic reticulum ATPase [Arthrobacter sp. UNCCL28]